MQDSWWSCLLFKMFVNLARPFFGKPFLLDGSKDYPQRLQSCENYWFIWPAASLSDHECM